MWRVLPVKLQEFVFPHFIVPAANGSASFYSLSSAVNLQNLTAPFCGGVNAHPNKTSSSWFVLLQLSLFSSCDDAVVVFLTVRLLNTEHMFATANSWGNCSLRQILGEEWTARWVSPYWPLERIHIKSPSSLGPVFRRISYRWCFNVVETVKRLVDRVRTVYRSTHTVCYILCSSIPR